MERIKKEWFENGQLKTDGKNEWDDNGNKKIEYTSSDYSNIGYIEPTKDSDSVYKEWYKTGEIKIINSKKESKMWFKSGVIKSEGYKNIGINVSLQRIWTNCN